MTQAKLIVAICVLSWPTALFAAVSVSEIAWMGTTASANHEWIELYNDSGPVDVTDWRITDGNNLNITLSGTLPSGYNVLERTSDDSASGAAWLIYTGALVNTGATLQLLNASDALIDQVAGGADWEAIGGDNDTKDTAQHTERGWATAPPTPGSAPPATIPVRDTIKEVVDSDVADDAQTTTNTIQNRTTSSDSSGDSGETVRLVLPGVTLQLAIDAQTVAYVNQSVAFTVTPSGVGSQFENSLVYDWNFGDGNTGSGSETAHTFRYPGAYVVTVYGAYKRQEQVARHEITVLPVALSLTTNAAGDVQLNNDSPYEIDISGYRVVGQREFVFPLRSIILPQHTITIPRTQLGGQSPQLLAVYDAAGASVALQLLEQLAAVPASAPTADALLTPKPVYPSVTPRPPSTVETVTAPTDEVFAFATPPEHSLATSSAIATTAPMLAAAPAAPAPSGAATNRAYILFAALLLGVIAVLYLAPVCNNYA